MGGRSDNTKYLTELATLFAWTNAGSFDATMVVDPERVADEVSRYLPGIMKESPDEFHHLLSVARGVRTRIIEDLNARGFPPVSLVDWQGNRNRNENDSPADILFHDHPVGGVSVKSGGPNLFNLGTKDLDLSNGREDLFRHLALGEFDALFREVAESLFDVVEREGEWTDSLRPDGKVGKYSIRADGEGSYRLACGDRSRTASRDQILFRFVPKRYLRVFGDYYQRNKETFSAARKMLHDALLPKLEEVFRKAVMTSPMKMAMLGGFTKNPYYSLNAFTGDTYYVPSFRDVESSLVVRTETKDGRFGAGMELRCLLLLGEEAASVDWHVRYHMGTFSSTPQNMIQNLVNREAIWKKVN